MKLRRATVISPGPPARVFSARWGAIAALALTVVLPACAARTTPAAAIPIPPPDIREQLRRDLHELFTAAAVAHAHWGINVYSLARHETLYSLNASHFMVPASNQKLLTTAVAAERLGWDHRFTTRVLANGPLAADGALHGDILIIGSGDPSINPRHPSRWRLFDDWAAALRSKGIKSVRRVIGDDNAFAEPGWGVGWAWDNLQYGYGAQVGALQYNENQIDVVVGPGSSPGTPAIIGTSPIGSGMSIANAVITAEPGAETELELARIPGSAILDVRGRIAAGAAPATLTAAVENPTRLFVNALSEALGRHGIEVVHGAADIDELRGPLETHALTELIVDQSPPLSEIIDVTMKWSRNGYAETLLLALAPHGLPATGTTGLQAVQETLATWGIVADGYLPRDGSGLSRYDYVSADTLTLLLKHLANDPRHAEVYRSTLPIAGVSGTLATRMKGTVAEGRVFAKTGSLSNVRALSGYVTTLDGERLIFSMIANNYRVSNAEIDAIVDNALVKLVEFRR
jgi:D-alanyl-D-alanine carboxypeptidase/D-alanyl-D-alanine-endopeptidase (penicillin-binding protein 4)